MNTEIQILILRRNLGLLIILSYVVCAFANSQNEIDNPKGLDLSLRGLGYTGVELNFGFSDQVNKTFEIGIDHNLYWKANIIPLRVFRLDNMPNQTNQVHAYITDQVFVTLPICITLINVTNQTTAGLFEFLTNGGLKYSIFNKGGYNISLSEDHELLTQLYNLRSVGYSFSTGMRFGHYFGPKVEWIFLETGIFQDLNIIRSTFNNRSLYLSIVGVGSNE